MEQTFRPRRTILMILLLIIVCGSGYGYFLWKQSKSTPAYFGKQAEVAWRAKNWPAAAQHLAALLEVDPTNDDARILLANVYRTIAHGEPKAGVDPDSLPDPPHAIPLLRQVAAHRSQDIDVRARLLFAYINLKDAASAKVLSQELLELRSGNLDAVNFLGNDLLATKYWEDADRLMDQIAWNIGEASPIYLRLQTQVMHGRGRLEELNLLLAKALNSQATSPAQQLPQLSAQELRFFDNVLMTTLRIAPTQREAEHRLLQALDVLQKMLQVNEDPVTRLALVEAALDIVADFSTAYPPPKRRLKFASRAGTKLPVHDEVAARILKIAAPLVESGEANAKVYEHVARAAMWADDESRSIVLLREGLRVYEELPPELRSELLAMHRDAALAMIARHDLGDGKVEPLMKNKETETIGQLLGAALALDRNQLDSARQFVLKAREDVNLKTASDALLLRIHMADQNWKAALELAKGLDDKWAELSASHREWLTKTQGGREPLKLVRAYCHFKLNESKELVEVAQMLDGTAYQSRARLLRIADLVREKKLDDAQKLVNDSRMQEPANFDLVMANIGVLLALKQSPQAIQLMSSYVSAYPEDVRGQVVFARWLSLRGQNQQAQALLSQTMAQFPDEPAARLMTAELMFSNRQDTELNQLLSSIRRPETANLILLIATMFELRRLGFDEAADALAEKAPGMPSNSNQVFANATTAFGNGQFQAGFEQLAESVNIRPTQNSPRSVFLQDLSTALQQTDRAARDKGIDDLAKKYPNDTGTLLIACELAVRRGDLRDALLHAEKLDAVDKVPGRAAYTRARILKLAGRSKAALNCVEDVFVDVPQHQEARTMAAELEFDLKNYQKCLDHLEHVSEEAKQATHLLFLRAEVLVQLERTQEAEPLLAAYVGREPDKEEARVNLAMLMRDHGRPDEAIQFLGQALLRMPNSVVMQTAYLDLLAETRKLPELERATRQFTNNEPDGNMSLRVARAFVTAGQFDNAQQWLLQARSKLRGDSQLDVSYMEGLIAHEKGKRSGYYNFFVQAKTKFEFVLKRNPKHVPSLRNALDLALFRFNELSNAVSLATTLRNTVPSRSWTEQDVDAIAEAYRQTGRLDEALDIVVVSLKRLPNSGALRFQYGAVLLEKADDEEHEELAKQQLQAAVQLGVPNHHLAELNAMLASFDKKKAAKPETTEKPETAAATSP